MAETLTVIGQAGRLYYDLKRVIAEGDYTYVLNRSYGVRMFYLPDKSVNANYVTGDQYGLFYGQDIKIVGGYLYTSFAEYLYEEFIEDNTYGGYFHGHPLIKINWDNIYIPGVNDYYSFLDVADLTDPVDPSCVTLLYWGLGYPETMVLGGDYLYIADGDTGLTIIDVSIPAAPTHVSSVAADAGWGYTAAKA